MKFDIINVANLLCTLQNRKILVLGDLMLDRFIDGAVTRISPEAPVPILSQSRTRQMAGGAANVACNLAQLGLHVHLIGVCGNDTAATDLETEIKAAETYGKLMQMLEDIEDRELYDSVEQIYLTELRSVEEMRLLLN